MRSYYVGSWETCDICIYRAADVLAVPSLLWCSLDTYIYSLKNLPDQSPPYSILGTRLMSAHIEIYGTHLSPFVARLSMVTEGEKPMASRLG